MTDTTIMTLIIIAYLVIVAVIGLAGTKLIKGSDDFMLAGRKLGPFMVIAGLTATHIGGGAVMGVSEDSYVYGVSGVAYSVGTALGLILLGVLSAERLRSLSLRTITDYLALRYNSKMVRGLASGLSIIAVTGIVAAQVNAAGGALAILGIDPTIGAIVAVLLFIAYTVFAGMWGVALTDAVQVIIVVIGVPIAAIAGLRAAGGLDGLRTFAETSGDIVSADYFSPVGMGVMAMLGIITPVIMYDLIGQDFYQRLFSARSAAVARISAISAGLLLLVFAIFPVIGGMSARALFGDLEHSSSALPTLISEVLPIGVAAVIVAAILAAVMSTADSLLIAGSTHITNDFYREIMGRDPEDDSPRTLAVARVWTLILGVGALVFALSVPGIITVLSLAYTMYASGVFVPVIGGLLWRRATRAGALAAIIAGSVGGLAGVFGLFDYGAVPEVVVGGVASLIAFVVFSLLTRPDTAAEHADGRQKRATEA
ncbi:MAG: sodium:solute symporter family protein [Brevibacterium yomogidense]|uniref:sodium:solute symporter family protein n=1 Tax=Brevibacterium sp. Mu109 TaxID=1255669 RepID=UPI000C46E09F|nr:sodium:solute symporter family protein [Brevibacterium sp. Mu109]SMX83837.1 solute:Na+ symporter, SSS family [Brevibacterium sp. Mu109]